jgi:hypothetical protein
MYDSVTPEAMPRGGQLYAGYLNGRWPTFSELPGLFGGKLYVSITITPASMADVLDVETGDATIGDIDSWVALAYSLGRTPVVYIDYSNYLDYLDSLDVNYVEGDATQPLWWVANPPRQVIERGLSGTLPGDWIAIQYMFLKTYDVSIVGDRWPGIDPEPMAKGWQAVEYVQDGPEGGTAVSFGAGGFLALTAEQWANCVRVGRTAVVDASYFAELEALAGVKS